MIVSEIASQVRERIPVSTIQAEDYVSTDNMRPNFGGIERSLVLPPSGTVTAFQEGDILLSNIRPYFRKTWLATRGGGCNADVLCIRANPEKCAPKYLYYLFTTDNFVTDYLKSCKGAKMPRGDVRRLLDYRFDLPDLPMQLRIAGIMARLCHSLESPASVLSSFSPFQSAPTSGLNSKESRLRAISLSSSAPLALSSARRDLKPAIFSANSSAVIGTYSIFMSKYCPAESV